MTPLLGTRIQSPFIDYTYKTFKVVTTNVINSCALTFTHVSVM